MLNHRLKIRIQPYKITDYSQFLIKLKAKKEKTVIFSMYCLLLNFKMTNSLLYIKKRGKTEKQNKLNFN